MAFVLNNDLKLGLPDIGSKARIATFEYDGDLYFLAPYQKRAWKWSTTLNKWEEEFNFPNRDVSFFGSTPKPTIFYWGEDLYLICGGAIGIFTGFKWVSANNQWESNTDIIAGLSNFGSYLSPTYFEHNSEKYLIVASNTDNTAYGYKWSTANSQWETDSSIVAGLPVFTINYPFPHVFNHNGGLYLLNDEVAWKWNTSSVQWESNPILSGIDILSYPTAATFYLDTTLNVLWGLDSGYFSGATLFPDAKLQSVGFENKTCIAATITVVLSGAAEASETITARFADTLAGLDDAANDVVLTTLDNITYECTIQINEGDLFYLRAIEAAGGSEIDSLDNSGTYFLVAQKNTTVINITDANNWVELSAPQHNKNHGSLFYNGYLYGSAREAGQSSIFKINAADYSDITQIVVYQDKAGSNFQITDLEQIVYCSGFLWCQRSGFLIRIDPATLDYMVFNGTSAGGYSQPIGTDGNYLYLNTNTEVRKLDTSLLIGSFASYGYTGAAAVAVPANTVLSSETVIQYHPTENIYVHSIQIDSQYIYLACTVSPLVNTYDNVLDIHLSHFQKIRKSDMVTVGDVLIPKCTDDMVQNGEYVFLAPEYSNSAYDLLGDNWGLLAIRKSDLTLKYLKALHIDFITNNLDRQAYGVFYFDDKITVQLVNSKKTIVIDLTDIESWGEFLPVGSATDAIFSFQINSIDLPVPCNELLLDNNGYVHTNTWEADTIVFKFTLATLTAAIKTPIIQTALIGSSSDNATIGGLILDEGQSPITDVGFRYSTDPGNLNINVDVTPDTYDFQTLLESLAPGIYYIQAWGINTEGTFYGNTVIFSTFNVLTMAYNNDDALLSWINELYGCSIRCVQDAPGEADGATGTATDKDGNVYKTIVINEKRWFVENLKTTKYRNDEEIPEVTDPANWAALNSGANCAYDNKQSNV